LPDGSGIVLISKSPPPPAPYYLFSVSTTTNLPATTPAMSGNIGAVNFAGAFDTDGAFVTVDASNGLQILTFSGTTSGTPAISAAASYFSIAPQLAPCWIERSPQTGHLHRQCGFPVGNGGLPIGIDVNSCALDCGGCKFDGCCDRVRGQSGLFVCQCRFQSAGDRVSIVEHGRAGQLPERDVHEH